MWAEGERDKAAAALQRAHQAEKTAKIRAGTIAEHEVLAESRRLELGMRTTGVGVAEREAEALLEEVENAKHQVRAAGGLSGKVDSELEKQVLSVWRRCSR